MNTTMLQPTKPISAIPSTMFAADFARASNRRSAFTLTELLVAVLVLVVVVLAAGKIFGTVGDVTRAGQANADILQTAAAIERQLRRDVNAMTTDGFLVIQSVAIPNDLHRATNPQAPLIDPTRPFDERVRSDRLLFFAHGATPSQQFVGSSQLLFDGDEQRIRDQAAVETRVQYGHGVQLGNRVRPRVDPGAFTDGTPLLPWSWDNPADGPNLEVTAFPRRGQDLPPAAVPLPPGQPVRVNGTQPPAPRWILARQRVLLADEGRSPFYYRANVLNPPGSAQAAWGPPNSTTGIWPNSLPNTFNRYLASSRVDVAATTLADIRRLVQFETTWPLRRGVMLDALVFPRAEAATQPITVSEAPLISDANLYRLESMLTSPTLAVGCSEFIVEWTYGDGAGRTVRPDGSPFVGMQINPAAEQPWFGLADARRAVFPLSLGTTAWDWGTIPPTIFPANIETGSTLPGNIDVYDAVFGYNRTIGFNDAGQPDVDLGFTPWPTALRITMTLHDQRGGLERGRQFQFVLPLPSR